jgi:hypothetical protein
MKTSDTTVTANLILILFPEEFAVLIPIDDSYRKPTKDIHRYPEYV